MKPSAFTSRPRRGQNGFVLIASLILMVVITLIAVAMFRGSGLQEKIADNLREKQRAFDIAQNTLTFGQNWLSANAPAPIACADAAATHSHVANTPVVCTQTSAYPPDTSTLMTDLQTETAGTTYTPSGKAALTISQNGGQDTIYAYPRLFIQNIGIQAGTGSPLYRLTAVAWGGNSSTVAIVQSIYALPAAPGAKDLGSIY